MASAQPIRGSAKPAITDGLGFQCRTRSTQDLELLVTSPPVDMKVRIEGQNSRLAKNLRATNEAGIRQGNWTVFVPSQERFDIRPVTCE